MFDTGADLEVGSSMIKLLKFGDMYPCMDTGAGIWLKIIQISINRVIKPIIMKYYEENLRRKILIMNNLTSLSHR